jgi:hypothetical protein
MRLRLLALLGAFAITATAAAAPAAAETTTSAGGAALGALTTLDQAGTADPADRAGCSWGQRDRDDQDRNGQDRGDQDRDGQGGRDGQGRHHHRCMGRGFGGGQVGLPGWPISPIGVPPFGPWPWAFVPPFLPPPFPPPVPPGILAFNLGLAGLLGPNPSFTSPLMMTAGLGGRMCTPAGLFTICR